MIGGPDLVSEAGPAFQSYLPQKNLLRLLGEHVSVKRKAARLHGGHAKSRVQAILRFRNDWPRCTIPVSCDAITGFGTQGSQVRILPLRPLSLLFIYQGFF